MSDRLLTLKEAQEFLSKHKFDCKSRKSYYKLEQDYNIPYIDLNPRGKKRWRRFKLSDLEDFVANPEKYLKRGNREETRKTNEENEE